MMTKKINPIVFLVISITLISCKTKQYTTTATATETSIAQTETLTEKSDSLKAKKLDYNWITYRANASLSSLDMNNFNVFVVNRRDSIIYITISKMGIEGARIVLTPDTVKFLNHLSSNYYIGNYAVLDKLVGFKTDFYMVQLLLTGGDTPERAKSFLQASYGNFTTVDAQPFFQQADFVVFRENLQLSLTVKSVKLNEAGPTSIRIPEKYTPIK